MKTVDFDIKKNRVDWIDCTKGIAILLVIIGHTVAWNRYGSILRGLIFSFHMPLFFILSGITYRCSVDEKQFVLKMGKAAPKLLVPAIIIYILRIIFVILKDSVLISNLSFWKGKLYTLIFASGGNASFGGMDVACMGAPWFFFALFLGRTIFDYIHLKFAESQLGIVCMIITLTGIIFGGGGGYNGYLFH